MGSFGDSLGNPGPLGLVAFGTTTFYLMTISMGWSSAGFTDNVAANAMYYGGLVQLIVGIAELIKGSSFSFLVFGSYGAFWMGFAELQFLTRDNNSAMGTEPDAIGNTMYYLQWTVLTTFFAFVAQRKSSGLTLLLVLLTITFLFLTFSSGAGIQNSSASLILQRIAGYFGFATALQAYYLAFAEIIDEEWGRHVLPGLKPLITVETISLSAYDQDEFAKKHMTYNKKTNTLMLSFRGIQILSKDDIHFICTTIERAILSSKSSSSSSSPPNSDMSLAVEESAGQINVSDDAKVHVIVDYQDAVIANDIEEEYKQSITELQRKYYLSVTRFGVSSFGTSTKSADFITSVRLG